jgi:alpha-glucuronidase
MLSILSILLCIVSSYANTLTPDKLWLRFDPITNADLRSTYIAQLKNGINVIASNPILNLPSSHITLQTVADELSEALSSMLLVHIPATCCSTPTSTTVGSSTLTVVVGDVDPTIDVEGYSLTPNLISSQSPSGALYGTYRYLSYLQRRLPLPGSLLSPLVSNPALTHRVWNMWDTLTGDVTRGFAGDSIIWPQARWKNNVGPPPIQLFIAPCSDSDPYQVWSGTLFSSTGAASHMRNHGNGKCVAQHGSGGVQVTSCNLPNAATTTYWYNASVKQISIGNESTPNKVCLDINHALGPDLDYYHCHLLGTRDYQNQQFDIEALSTEIEREKQNISNLNLTSTSTPTPTPTPTYRLKSVSAANQCITLRNSFPPSPDTPTDVTFQHRWDMMLRHLKSVGVNSISLNDVNACGLNTELLSTPTLTNVTTNLRPALEKYAITPFFSACFAAPTLLDNVTSNPKDLLAIQWWKSKVNEIYTLMPSFGGFLVKADSEGNLGPQSFNCTEAEGANMLARAVQPHNGTIFWRAFVYGNDGPIGKEELVKQAYDTFVPLDGHFDSNVIVQIKNGPMDFQIREPLHPLLGGLRKTNVMMEVQCAQEYTGQQIHAVNLVTMWSEYMKFDTKQKMNGTNGTTIADLLSSNELYSRKSSGIACVSNFGSYANWTGHVFAASNTYGFGRLAWDPSVPSSDINTEWTQMTFPTAVNVAQSPVENVVVNILDHSREIYEGYTSPLAIGFMVFGGYAGEGPCAPKTAGPGVGPYGMTCPISPGRRRLDRRGGLDHYWVDPCSNYYFQNSSHDGLGCRRIAKSLGGTGYSHQYHPENAAIFDDIHTCPQKLLLWFHHVDWHYPHLVLKNGTKTTLIEYIRITHEEALVDVRQMLVQWKTLRKYVDVTRWKGVVGRMEQQIQDANVMGKKIVGFYQSLVQSTF